VVYEGADHAFMRVGEQPADKNPANRAAVQSALARLAAILKGI
jgi:carboxymethylenebutenolidase